MLVRLNSLTTQSLSMAPASVPAAELVKELKTFFIFMLVKGAIATSPAVSASDSTSVSFSSSSVHAFISLTSASSSLLVLASNKQPDCSLMSARKLTRLLPADLRHLKAAKWLSSSSFEMAEFMYRNDLFKKWLASD